MPEGYFVSRASAANSSIPIPNAMVTVTQGAELLAVRTTDRSGRTTPVTVSTPEESESLSPGNGIPFASVDVTIEHPDYLRIVTRGVQIFPGQLTEQNFTLIPLSLLPRQWNQTETFNTPPQNL